MKPEDSSSENSLQALHLFLAQARQRYDELEQALMPMGETIADLEQDWNPRGEPFWQRVSTALLPLRQTVDGCLALYDQRRSPQPALISALFAGVSIEQSCVLFYLRSRIEVVGIRLTSYQHRASFAEKHLQQRQGVLQGMRDLDEAGQKALQKGRVWFERVLVSQRQAFSLPSSSVDASRTRRGKRRRIANMRGAKSRPALRLMGKQEQENGW